MKEWVYRPIAVEIEISHQCNLRCSGCAILEDIKRAKYRLSEERLLDFLDQAGKCGIESCALTGGEPFLHFELIKKVIQKSPIDLHKINTNGYIFYSPDMAKRVLIELKNAGFVSRNKKIKSWLNISIGQQNVSGIPIENSVFAAYALSSLFSPSKAGFSLNVFSRNEAYEFYIIRKFIRKYREFTGKDYNEKQYPIKLIPADTHGCSTVSKFRWKKKKMTLKKLIDYYLDEEKVVIHCLQDESDKLRHLLPRMLLRADGSVYSCAGFSHVFNLGNVYHESLEDMLKKANEDKIIRTLFHSGLRGLLKTAKIYQPGIGERMIPISHGPCDICRILKKAIVKAIVIFN